MIYIVVNVLLSQLAKYVERRTRRSPKTAAAHEVELPGHPGGHRPERRSERTAPAPAPLGGCRARRCPVRAPRRDVLRSPADRRTVWRLTGRPTRRRVAWHRRVAATLRGRPGYGLLQHLVLMSRRRLDAPAGTPRWSTPPGPVRQDGRAGHVVPAGQPVPPGRGHHRARVARRRPVALATYADVRAGHLAADEPARHGAVLSAALVARGRRGRQRVFAGPCRRFTVAEIDDLELLTQAVVPRLVRIAVDEPAWAHLLPPPDADRPDPVPRPRPVEPGAGPLLTRRERETIALLAPGG